MSLIIARKYSKALLEIAQERQQLEAVLAEVAAFNQVIQSTDLQDFLVDVAYSMTRNTKSLRVCKMCPLIFSRISWKYW